MAVDASSALVLLAEQRFDMVVAAVEPPADTHAPRAAFAMSPELVCLRQPLSSRALMDTVGELEDRIATRHLLEHARRTLAEVEATDQPIVGQSRAIQLVLARLSAIAMNDAPVLLTGESGTGKELLAHMLHKRSNRRDRPLVIVNCAAFPDTLIDAELFGYERGAFTGATQRRDGRFKAAEGGTLFLDEVNGLSLGAQAKLLRVLQDGRFQPLGTNTEVEVNVRLISATNRELSAMVAEGTFRGDLYYRIKVLDLDVPPVRERAGDLPLLVAHFLRKHAPQDRRPTLSPRAWAAISAYSFPGNVRELEHALQRAIVLAGTSEIGLEHLPREIAPNTPAVAPAPDPEIRPLAEAVRAFEREYLRQTLETAHGNKTRAARMLGISRKHLWEKLRQLGLLANTRHQA